MVVGLLVLFAAAQAALTPSPSDEVKDALAKAENFYYEARFNESIQVLAQVHQTLSSQKGRVKDRIGTNLQLALSFIGLNDQLAAKSYLTEIYSLDPDFALDRRQFSPKVLALADEARADQQKNRCQAADSDARILLADDNIGGILDLMHQLKGICADLSAVEQVAQEAADTQYRKGLTEYKRGEYTPALQSFRTALSLSPKHDLAGQYLDLTQGKLQVDLDRTFMQWQQHFQARAMSDAAADYRRLAAVSGNADSPLLKRAGDEYRRALSTLVDSWEKTCAAGDTTAVSAIESQIKSLIPDPNFGKDLRAKVGACAPKPVKAEPPIPAQVAANNPAAISTPAAAIAPRAGCLQMQPAAALIRLKTRVNPEVTREMLTYLQNSRLTVVAKIRIDESGGVNLLETAGANVLFSNSLKASVPQWKFTPTMDASGPRCVETEIPITFGR
jgi:tetratricopeptide (TPR) repeat protein